MSGRCFRIRACPACCEVQMPKPRDDYPWCRNSGVKEEYGGHREQVRLAWFEVTEDDFSYVNDLNEEARAAGSKDEFTRSGDRVRRYNWVTGDAGWVTPAAEAGLNQDQGRVRERGET